MHENKQIKYINNYCFYMYLYLGGMMFACLSRKTYYDIICFLNKIKVSGALSDRMLPVRIIENNRIDAYFKAG